MELRTLIVEDEIIIANDLAAVLGDIGIEHIVIVSSGEDALATIEKRPFDFILMDVALNGKMDGVDTVKIINQKYKIPVIYLTANTDDKTFLRAKLTQPFSFIEKPFKKRTLIRNIELLIERLLSSENPQENVVSLKDRIFLRENNGLTKIHLKDILYLSADRAYCKIFTDGKVHYLSSALGKIEKKINSPLLRRIHRSFVVNIEKIDRIEQGNVIINGKSIPIGPSFSEDLDAFLKII